MQDLQTKFTQAKALIQAKRYAEARALLKQIEHPKAQEWLTKLDEIDPPKPAEEDIFAFPDVSSPEPDWRINQAGRPGPSVIPPKPGQRSIDNIPYTNFEPPKKSSNMAAFYILVGAGIFIFAICLGCAVAGNIFANRLGDTIEALVTQGPGVFEGPEAYARATQRGTLVLNGAQGSGTISSTTVAEKWTLQVNSTSPITIRVFGANGYDTALILYDANGRVLTSADDTIGIDPKIDYTPPSPGTYYIVVKEWGSLDVVFGGSYTVIATQ